MGIVLAVTLTATVLGSFLVIHCVLAFVRLRHGAAVAEPPRAAVSTLPALLERAIFELESDTPVPAPMAVVLPLLAPAPSPLLAAAAPVIVERRAAPARRAAKGSKPPPVDRSNLRTVVAAGRTYRSPGLYSIVRPRHADEAFEEATTMVTSSLASQQW